MRFLRASSLAALAVALANPVLAQDDAPPEPSAQQPGAVDETDDYALGTEILVVAAALSGTVDTDQPPLLELNEQDIAAYGASSIADLIAALGDTAGSGRGQRGGFPVILVNGMRISSFRELRSYPPEAIQKVEVFPEEVAQQYGYSADQRVVNLILKQNFASREVELEYGQPFRGGTSTKEGELTWVQIAGANRLNFNLGYETSSLLTEAERGIVQTTGSIPVVAGDPDQALYRSLVSDSERLQFDGNWSSRLGNRTTFSVNASFQQNDGLSLQGLDSVVLTDQGGNSVLRTFGEANPLTVDTRGRTYAASLGINSSLGSWQLATTVDGSHATSSSEIRRRADSSALVAAAAAGTLDITGPLPAPAGAGFDEAASTTDSLSGKATLIGRAVTLPAGDVSLTLDGGYDWTQIERRDTRTPGGPTSLDRGNLNGGFNASIPLTSVRDDALAAIGDTTLQLSAGIDELSDFGTLYDWSAGLVWSPADGLSFNASYIRRDRAPSLAQLGNPEIATPNVQVFDLSRNETVLATVITGGNPNLPAEAQSNFKIGANVELPFMDNARLSIDYYDDHSDDVTAGFPTLTPTIEAAFPGRITRDAAGRLIQADLRPVTFASQDSRRIQVGLNLGGALGKPRQSARQGDNPLGAVFGAIRGGGPGGGPGQGSQGGAAAQGGQSGAQGQRGPGGPGAGQGGFGGGQFNPQAFQQMRESLCAEGAEVTPEMLADLPDFLRQRFVNADGTVNAEAVAQAKERMCSAGGGAMAMGGPGGPPGGPGNFDPAVMAAFRAKLCGDEALTLADLESLPEGLRQVLLAPDGTISENRVLALKSRICQQPGAEGTPAARGGQRSGDAPRGDGPGGGPVFIGGAPGGGGPGGGGPGGGGFRGGPPGGDGRGRWFANLNYTYSLEEKVLITPGGPVLDLLDGDALGGNGRTRHGATLNGGFFYAGFGSRYQIRYTGRSTLEGSGLPGSTDLTFHDYVAVDLRLFADLNERTGLIEAVPLLRNTRVSIGIDNLFDARQRVTDSNGDVPVRYQPFLVDPIGRSFEIELRKMF